MRQYRCREVKRMLKEFDKRFQFLHGSGNAHQWTIFHPDIDGVAHSCALPDHGSATIAPHVLSSIRRRFNLPGNFFK